MRTLKLTLAYDGTRFVGWQRQAEGESIQGQLEEALARFEGGPVTVHGAGRTDAGVHALGQVASVRLTCGHDVVTLARALNAQLPPDIRVLRVEEAPERFHARFSARLKTYRYQLRLGAVASPFDRAYVWHVPERLDIDAMQAAASAIVGTHDFAAFQSVGSVTNGTVRTIVRSAFLAGEAAQWAPSGPQTPSATLRAGRNRPTYEGVLAYEVAGDGFLRHMVRAIVGTLVEIGRGWRAPGSMTDILAERARGRAGATAPPHGLFLVGVDYDE